MDSEASLSTRTIVPPLPRALARVVAIRTAVYVSRCSLQANFPCANSGLVAQVEPF